MPENVTLTFEFSADFDEQGFLNYMSKAQAKKPTGEYERRVWSINGLTIKQYHKKLVVQGSLNDFTKKFLQGLKRVKGITLDQRNAMKFVQIFPSKHNAILCPVCNDAYLVIEGVVEALEVMFRGECGHRNDLTPPFFMLNARILPDISMLISKSLSRLVELGHLNGFEVILPEFILDVVNQFKRSASKDAVSAEFDSLRALAKEGKIRINTLSTPPIDISSPQIDEDRVILDLAHLTNAILVTSDKLFKDRAVMQERPTVYISPDDFGKLKMIQEVRNP